MKSVMAGRPPPPLTPPHKGEGGVHVGVQRLMRMLSSSASLSNSPSPLWGGVRGGGKAPATAMERRA